MADIDDRWFRVDRATGEKVPTARHGKGLQWAARWRDDSGAQRMKSFRTKRDADAHLAQVAVDLSRGEYVDPKAGRIRLRDFVEEWIGNQTSNVSSQHAFAMRLRAHVVPALGDKQLVAIKPHVVQAWLRGLQGTVSDNYLRALLSNFSAVMQAAVDDGRIAKNPCRAASVKAPAKQQHKVVPWSSEWVAAAYATLSDRYAEVVTVGAGLGLRQGEILGLAVEDVDWLRKVVHVRRQIKRLRGRLFFSLPKGGKERDVPLPESVSIRLAAHLQAQPAVACRLPWGTPDGKARECSLIFTNRASRPINRNAFNERVWHPALTKACIPHGRENGMHALRHRFASVVLDGGASIRDLAEWLGHTDPGFTLRTYAHMLPSSGERMRQAVDAGFEAVEAASRKTGM